MIRSAGNAHSGQLGRRATDNLLDPEGEELILELGQLLAQVILRPMSIDQRV